MGWDRYSDRQRGCGTPQRCPVRGLWRGQDSPIADFTTLPLTVALFLPGSGALFLRLAAPAALRPARPRWSPGGTFARPATGRGTESLQPYRGAPFCPPAHPGPAGSPGGSSSSRPRRSSDADMAPLRSRPPPQRPPRPGGDPHPAREGRLRRHLRLGKPGPAARGQASARVARPQDTQQWP